MLTKPRDLKFGDMVRSPLFVHGFYKSMCEPHMIVVGLPTALSWPEECDSSMDLYPYRPSDKTRATADFMVVDVFHKTIIMEYRPVIIGTWVKLCRITDGKYEPDGEFLLITDVPSEHHCISEVDLVGSAEIRINISPPPLPV